MLLNELFNCLFFSILAIPYLSNIIPSKEKVGTICIFILMASIMTTVLFNVSGTVKYVFQFCKKRNQIKISVQPPADQKEIEDLGNVAYLGLGPHNSFESFS